MSMEREHQLMQVHTDATNTQCTLRNVVTVLAFTSSNESVPTVSAFRHDSMVSHLGLFGGC